MGLFALMDRLVMGAFQRRSGPYSIGWFGLLQPIVDGIKLIKKESIGKKVPKELNISQFFTKM